MSNIYLYVDEKSREVLLGEKQKIISIGGDFGHGNFGDIIQNINSLNLTKKTEKFAAVSVMAVGAIGFKEFPAWARTAYGADAIIFIADYPLILDDNSPSLELVSEVRNVAAVQMYGGGFLNNMWGNFVLEVVEYFLHLSPQANYIVSGQQITSPFQKRLLRHINEFKPALFGVRDDISYQYLQEIGFDPQFSFDDASEILCQMKEKLSLRSGAGVLMHLNVSNYTANDNDISRMGDDLSLLSKKMGDPVDLTLFQAFKDTRQDVLDSREALKLLDNKFPFNDFRGIELASFAYGTSSGTGGKPVVGELGYSCSYHVALFLQLSGIPCWLRSSNPFYDQKSKALQVTQDWASFLQEPRLADHRMNLERRAQWLNAFEKSIDSTPEVRQVSRVPKNNDGPAPWPFFFKGKPTLEERLESVQEQTQHLNKQVDDQNARARQLRMQVDGYREQLSTLGSELHLQLQREKARHAEYTRQAQKGQEFEAMERQIQQMLHSRSWRLTRPLRAMARYATHGYFDSHGQVGLYGLMQKIGRRLPLSESMRSRIGKMLSKLRRRGGK